MVSNKPPPAKRENGNRQLPAENQNTKTAQADDRQFQADILPGVSRTFALTIPTLPPRLTLVVTNAYLLCRIADTIEDDPLLDIERKEASLGRFLAVVEGRDDATDFSASVAPLLAADIPPAESELMRNIPRVIAVTHSFSDAERRILARCVNVMCVDMPRFQRNSSRTGLRDLPEFDAYCYAVAGVVGELLTDLFCIHCPELEPSRAEMRKLAVSFGQGLQMTNILKDVWDDYERGACWLPRSVFEGGDGDGGGESPLDDLPASHRGESFQRGLGTLLSIANGHLRNALEFTCRIPPREKGIRRFCLWALGMAVLTVGKIERNRLFADSSEVKISRRAVRATILATNLLVSNNRGLRLLFRLAARRLPNQ